MYIPVPPMEPNQIAELQEIEYSTKKKTTLNVGTGEPTVWSVHHWWSPMNIGCICETGAVGNLYGNL